MLAAISGLEYKARLIVEGFLSGSHRSPYRGFSVEFAQHREYVPGDDLRHLDWKVWGRTDRLYVKQYDAETNFECSIVLDASGSMGFGTGVMTKLEYAKHAAAALGYLVLQQSDAFGLVIFGNQPVNLTPSSSPARLKEMLHHIEEAQPGGGSSVGRELFGLAERSGRRKVIIVLSDFLDSNESLMRSLRLLYGRRHDILLVHLLDPAEIAFPYTENTVFEGFEGEGRLRIEPGRIKKTYFEELKNHVKSVRNAAREMRMDHLLIVTDSSLAEILSAYLLSRSARK